MENSAGSLRRRANSAKKQSFLPQTFTAVPEGYAPTAGPKPLNGRQKKPPSPAPSVLEKMQQKPFAKMYTSSFICLAYKGAGKNEN
jgi:hypothetical protein